MGSLAGATMDDVIFAGFVIVLGPNGVGKLRDYEGTIRLNGTDIKTLDHKEIAKHVAYIPQSTHPVFNYTVFDVVLMGLINEVNLLSELNQKHIDDAYAAMESLSIAHLRGTHATVRSAATSGKTSTMNAASFFIPSVAKIVSIEDTREISPDTFSGDEHRPHHLLNSACRQRQGSNRPAAHNPINVPIAMFGALNLILVQSLLYGEAKGFRWCLSLNEVSVGEDSIGWQPLFTWDHMTDRFVSFYEKSAVFDNIAYQNNWSKDQLEEKLAVRKASLERMVAERKNYAAGRGSGD